jgi:cation:H+ antiporter
MTVLVYIGLAIVGTAIVWWGSEALETASEQLAAYYMLPPIVQGAVIAAVGSSFPELSSTVLATLIHGTFDLGVSAIVGSAIFNILVIPGLSGVMGDGLVADRDLVYKDAQFYVTAVAVLLLTFALAVIYDASDDANPLTGTMTRPLAMLPVALYGVYLFLQQQDSGEYDAPPRPPDLRAGRVWTKLSVSLVIIVVGVEALVVAALGLGEALNTPPFLWGVTVVAAGTSLPDAFISVRAAMQGNGTVSLGNALGSNTFDLLIAVPAGVLVAGSATIDFAVAVPMMGFLMAVTIIFFALLRIRLNLTKRESVVLLALYGVFLVWMGLETAGVLSYVT